ncbi:hypothetical protein goonie_65 [Pseudomonas phage goonie]|uniref:Uncharacterized protein n=1 Tax=Pseudomonas phage goonie TaxID=2719837 RepID=A0A6H2A9X6_9CAUD|nr:hypothetical protein goonie_65 [Pseudomonas phage goonie]
MDGLLACEGIISKLIEEGNTFRLNFSKYFSFGKVQTPGNLFMFAKFQLLRKNNKYSIARVMPVYIN